MRLVWSLGFGGESFQIRDDHLDVVLLVAIELLERVDADDSTIGSHQLVTLLADPGCDRLMMSLAAANDGCAQVEMVRFPGLRGRHHAAEQGLECPRREGLYGLVRVRVMLNAETGVQE